MNTRWTILIGILVCVGMVVALVGCSGGSNSLTSSQGPYTSAMGTVRLVMAKPQILPAVQTTRQAVPVDIAMQFQEISLLNPRTSITAPAKPDWQSIYGPNNPNIPIPICDGPTLVDLLSGQADANFVDVAKVQVPAQLYSKIRLLFNPADFSSLAGLQVDLSKLKSIIPITGDMQVNPGETVTLVVDFLNGKAYVPASQ